MRERPILMSAPMVRALLAGTKTQTRRVVRPQPQVTPGMFIRWERHGEEHRSVECTDHFAVLKCPYGQPGYRLWVRETGWERPHRSARDMREGADTWKRFYYDADGLSEGEHEQFKECGFKRRPSIHMPRWASRITLEITDVRVERLWEISLADVQAEGCPFPPKTSEAASWYRSLWDQINGPGSWEANPWVWALTFRRMA